MSNEVYWQWASCGLTDVGKVRKINEDAILDRPQAGLWVVADGMGGHNAGDVASSRIIEALSEQPPAEGVVDWVEDQIRRVNYEMYYLSKQGDSDGVIGSTVVAMVALQGYCVCIWAGDSRVYRLRDYQLEQITVDHSHVEELIADGLLDRAGANGHPGENIITRAVGGEDTIELGMQLVPLQAGDRFLLCSDGLYKELSDHEMAETLASGDAVESCRRLMDRALAGRCADNVSVITIDFSQH